HPPAVGRAKSARPRAWPAPYRRKHSLRARCGLPEDDAVDAQRAHRRAPHLSASRVQARVLGTTRELGPPGDQRALGFGVVKAVIPGPSEAQSPESITPGLAELSPEFVTCGLWIPGSRLRRAPE